MTEVGTHEDRGVHEGGAAEWHHGGAVGVGEATDGELVMHHRCVVYCRDPWPGGARFKCPSCRGRAFIEPKDGPEAGRSEIAAAWFGRVWRAFWDGFHEAGAVLKVREKAEE